MGRSTLSPDAWLAWLRAGDHLSANLPRAVPAREKEGTMNPNARSLAVEATGDPWRGKIAPRIRIGGQWLERVGFKPGHRVEVRLEQPGAMPLRFLAQASYAGRDSGL